MSFFLYNKKIQCFVIAKAGYIKTNLKVSIHFRRGNINYARVTEKVYFGSILFLSNDTGWPAKLLQIIQVQSKNISFGVDNDILTLSKATTTKKQ